MNSRQKSHFQVEARGFLLLPSLLCHSNSGDETMRWDVTQEKERDAYYHEYGKNEMPETVEVQRLPFGLTFFDTLDD